MPGGSFQDFVTARVRGTGSVGVCICCLPLTANVFSHELQQARLFEIYQFESSKNISESGGCRALKAKCYLGRVWYQRDVTQRKFQCRTYSNSAATKHLHRPSKIEFLLADVGSGQVVYI